MNFFLFLSCLFSTTAVVYNPQPLRGAAVGGGGAAASHDHPQPRWNVAGGLGNGQVAMPNFRLKRISSPELPLISVEEIPPLDSATTETDTLHRLMELITHSYQYLISVASFFSALLLVYLILVRWKPTQHLGLKSFFLWQQKHNKTVTTALPRTITSSSSTKTRRLIVHGGTNKSSNKSILPRRARQTEASALGLKKKDDKEQHSSTSNTNLEEDTLQQMEMQHEYHQQQIDTHINRESSSLQVCSARLRKQRRDLSSTTTISFSNNPILTVEEYTPVISNYNKGSPQHTRNVLYSSPLHDNTAGTSSSLPPLPQIPSPHKFTPYSLLESLPTQTSTTVNTTRDDISNNNYLNYPPSPPRLSSFYTPPPSPNRPKDIKNNINTRLLLSSPQQQQHFMSTIMDSKLEEEDNRGLYYNNTLDDLCPTPTLSLTHLSRSRHERMDPSMIQIPYCDFSTTSSPDPKKEEERKKEGLPSQLEPPSSLSPSYSGIIHKRKNLVLDGSSDSSTSLSTQISLKEIHFHSLIGGGGFGQVWSASWKGTPVAVKRISPTWIFFDNKNASRGNNLQNKNDHNDHNIRKELQRSTSWNEKKIQEFCAEVNLLSGMRHPNICLYMGACLEYPNLAIVTELASNGSLWDALRLPLKYESSFLSMDISSPWPVSMFGSKMEEKIPQSTWSWYLIKRVAHGAARGMNYLHNGVPPILHRDLKSANLLLDECYNPKIADFGFSRLKAQQQESMTGNCGTVQWMAPEILSNRPYAEPADVYSYGIILWELLTKECPFDGMSAIQCALAVINTDARPVIPQWCPDSLASLIHSCFNKNPLSRPTFSQIIKAFDSMP